MQTAKHLFGNSCACQTGICFIIIFHLGSLTERIQIYGFGSNSSKVSLVVGVGMEHLHSETELIWPSSGYIITPSCDEYLWWKWAF